MNNFEISNLKSEILPPDCPTGKTTLGRTIILLLATLFLSFAALAQSTAFTYQGRLNHADSPATGLYEITFTLYDSMTNGNVIATPVTLAPVPVTNGLLTATLDFGAAAFVGADRWLEISVTVFGSDQPVVTLVPRLLLTPTPYALHAHNAAGLMSFANAPLDIKVNGRRALRLEPTFDGHPNIIGGADDNSVTSIATGATIGGGYLNLIGAGAATIAGGVANIAAPAADYAAIGGGFDNHIGEYSQAGTIGGGYGNAIQGRALNATLGGGVFNTIQTNASYATLAGGSFNMIMTGSAQATISGGWNNTIEPNSRSAIVAGGIGNTIERNGQSATIGGGSANRIGADSANSTIGGGTSNGIGADSENSTIGGGEQNRIATNSWDSTIGGGSHNDIGTNSFLSVIAGGSNNNIANNASRGAIAGGEFNNIGNGASFAFIGGGGGNSANSSYSTIGGGTSHYIGTNAALSFIGGGFMNHITNDSTMSAIGGGQLNRIGPNSFYASIAGGYNNTIAANSAYGTIPGGDRNSATNYAFAAGSLAKANHTGAFVWGDFSGTDVTSTNANSVTMRASGGYRLFSNSNYTAGVYLAPGSGAWDVMSDRNAKENFTPTQPRAVLEKVAALPIATWNYKSQDKSIRHIGPTAQDFQAAFNLGENDRTITTVDADGVALAAIQGLNQKLEQELKTKDAQICQLQSDLAEVKQLLQALTAK